MKKWQNAFQLMRIPFSVFLMPVFWFACANAPSFWAEEWWRIAGIFVVIHLFLYPASNGYNSYYDKDESPIGGLKNPPKVGVELFYLINLFDLLTLYFAWKISIPFLSMMLIYKLISKAYSHPWIRLKKYPWISAFVVSFFQGFWIYISVHIGMGAVWSEISSFDLICAIISSLFLLGSYPLTQIYQHKEDAKNGDLTASRVLGIKGTLIFSSVVFGASAILYTYNFFTHPNTFFLYSFFLFTIPMLAFFGFWNVKVFKDESYANHSYTMKMNAISSLCMSALYISQVFMR